MAKSESVELLIAGIVPSPREFTSYRKLAERLGEWPLALELANSALRAYIGMGEPAPGAVDLLTQDLIEEGVAVIRRTDTDELNRSIIGTIHISLRLAAKHHAEAVEQYRALTIFPEDSDVPLRTVSMVLGLTIGGARRLCMTLASLSLLKLDLTEDTIRFHAVVREVISSEIEDPVALHARLLESWGDAHNLPDAYAWRYIAYHLIGARRVDALYTLLLDYSWIKAKLTLTDVNGLLHDYRMALTQAERGPAIEGNDKAGALQRLQKAIRVGAYALVTDPAQLWPQLVARLRSTDSAGIAQLLSHPPRGSWLRLISCSVQVADGPLRRSIASNLSHWTNTIAITEDATIAVVKGNNHDLLVIDLEDGQVLRQFAVEAAAITGLDITPDASYAVAGCSDGTVRFWNLETGKSAGIIQQGGGPVAITPDGSRVVTPSENHGLSVWESNSGRLLHQIEGHRDRVVMVLVTSDGRYAASVSWGDPWTDDKVKGKTILYTIQHGTDQSFCFYDLDKGERLMRIETTDFPPSKAVAVARELNRAITSDFGRLIVFTFDTAEGSVKLLEEGHDQEITALAINDDGTVGLSGSFGGEVKVWDLGSPRLIGSLDAHASKVTAAILSRDGQCAITTDDHTLRVWDLSMLPTPSMAPRHRGAVSGLAVSKTADRVISCSREGDLISWDVVSAAVRVKCHLDSGWLCALSVTTNGKTVVTAAGETTYAPYALEVWDMEHGQRRGKLGEVSRHVFALVNSPDERLVISAGADDTVRVWDLRNFRAGNVFTGHSAPVVALAITPDSRYAISGSWDHSIRIWDLDDERQMRVIEGHEERLREVVVTPDGQYIVASGDDGVVIVWNLATGQPRIRIRAHEPRPSQTAILKLSVSPSGRYLVTAGADNSLKVWDIETGRLLFTDNNTVFDAEFLPQGYLITGDTSGAVTVREIETWRILARFVAESEIYRVAASPDGKTIFAGDRFGYLHFLQLVNLAGESAGQLASPTF
jgi:WD40 repeat protein